MHADALLTRSWCRFAYDETLARWVDQALPAACATLAAGDNAKWLRCGGTWSIGVNALPNDADGALAGGTPVSGRAVDFIRNDLNLTDFEWDRAQVSVVYPGYPRPMASESAAAFRYRIDRDAAHVDGVKREGPRRRRHLLGHHRFILGIPMVETSDGASPLVVWEGSHEFVRRAFLERFGAMPPVRWRHEDITVLYHCVRQEIFAGCERVELVAQPGEAYLVHRLALHGIAPWSAAASASSHGRMNDGPMSDGRMIIYFRPETEAVQSWLTGP